MKNIGVCGCGYYEYNNIKDYEKWVRVEVHDESGRYAWSNILVL